MPAFLVAGVVGILVGVSGRTDDVGVLTYCLGAAAGAGAFLIAAASWTWMQARTLTAAFEAACGVGWVAGGAASVLAMDWKPASLDVGTFLGGAAVLLIAGVCWRWTSGPVAHRSADG